MQCALKFLWFYGDFVRDFKCKCDEVQKKTRARRKTVLSGIGWKSSGRNMKKSLGIWQNFMCFSGTNFNNKLRRCLWLYSISVFTCPESHKQSRVKILLGIENNEKIINNKYLKRSEAENRMRQVLLWLKIIFSSLNAIRYLF